MVDSGRFKWGAGKHPLYDTPDSSYHGLRWGHDLPPELAPLAFILRMRTVPLRADGSALGECACAAAFSAAFCAALAAFIFSCAL